MKISIIATIVSLALGAVAIPEHAAAARELGLEARAGCPNGGSLNACTQTCEGVVSRACAACKDSVCKTACQHGARMSKCLDCCLSRCSTC